MKKIFMTLAAAFVAVSMNAQVYVGGNLGFVSTSYDGNSTTAFAIMPEVGYNLGEDMAVGLAFGYGEKGKDETKVKVLTVNPYFRYNYVKLQNVKLFFDGSFDFTSTDNKASHKVNEWGIGIKPGVSVNLNEKVGFVAHMGFLGYRNSKPDYDGAKSTSTVGLALEGSDLSFGFYYNF